jgi:hypothetical protein
MVVIINMGCFFSEIYPITMLKFVPFFPVGLGVQGPNKQILGWSNVQTVWPVFQK